MNQEINKYQNNSENQDIALVIASYQPNEKASELLRIAITSITKFTKVKYSLWVIDVGSPSHPKRVNPNEFPNVNFIYIKKTPIRYGKLNTIKKILTLNFSKKELRDGSYINAWSLQYATEYFGNINYKPKYFMSLQMDIMITKSGWMKDCLLSEFSSNKVIAVGVRKQKCLDKSQYILHSLGCLWKYDLFMKLNLDFWSKIPNYDVGELAIIKSLNKGYEIKHLLCTYNDVIDFDYEDVYEDFIYDRVFNRSNEIIFLHLGRGINKSNSKNGVLKNKLDVNDWKEIYNHYSKN
jgi:hypothetical protein